MTIMIVDSVIVYDGIIGLSGNNNINDGYKQFCDTVLPMI